MKAFILTSCVVFCSTVVLAQNEQSGKYVFRLDKPEQIIWGLGVEIQNDAIGSGNRGLPDEVIAVPSNLVPSERKRFYKEILKGFRYCRLAMGLYFRGLDSTKSRVIERYPNQLNDLKEMIRESGMEGISMEYWSPAPYWKSTNSYIGGTLKQFDKPFLTSFANALVDDLSYMKRNGVKVSMWGLQNEPGVGDVGGLTLSKSGPQSYSHCVYSPEQYLQAFKVVAPIVKKALPPGALLIVDSHEGHTGEIGKKIREDKELLPLVDAWVYHRIGANSNRIIQESPMYKSNNFGKPVFQNEFEYQRPTNDTLFINTAQSVMNWFTFANSPTWYWLHALKPTYNVEASGYSLGFWRPEDDNDFTRSSQIKKGHWDYNPQNFNALAGFLKYMPWNSQRLHVEEDKVRQDNRILAYKTPANKLVFVVTNRTGSPFTFNISSTSKKTFRGYRYTAKIRNRAIGENKGGEMLAITVPHNVIEFWVEK
jgi:O-glycosyl hydrolase